MSFANPIFAWVAAGVALATVALHLLAWRRPPATPLPTARFVPETPVRTVSRDVRPADLALLALRVALVLFVGGALAGPIFESRSGGIGRVVVVDRSHAGVSSRAVTDSARAMFRPGNALVVFDSTAREITNPATDSIAAAGTTGAAGSLSAALILAIRAATRLLRERDSVEIVVVSPFASDVLDAATAPIRRMWPGVIRTVRAGAPPNAVARSRPVVRATPGDPLSATLALAGDMPGGGNVRVVRDASGSSDSAWARDGHTLVVWPASGTPDGWAHRSASDTSFAVSVPAGAAASAPPGRGSATVVAPFTRSANPPPGRVVARWQDGDPAATDLSLGTGCIRAVSVALPSTGDLALTPAFRRFSEALMAPCQQARGWVSVSDSVLAEVIPHTVTRTFSRRVMLDTALAPGGKLAAWLLGLALLAALAELALRRGVTDATA